MTAASSPRLVVAYVGPARGLAAYLIALATAARTSGGAK